MRLSDQYEDGPLWLWRCAQLLSRMAEDEIGFSFSTGVAWIDTHVGIDAADEKLLQSLGAIRCWGDAPEFLVGDLTTGEVRTETPNFPPVSPTAFVPLQSPRRFEYPVGGLPHNPEEYERVNGPGSLQKLLNNLKNRPPAGSDV